MRIELIFELICVHIITLQTRLETRRLCLPWERLNNQFCLQLISIVRCPKGQWRVKDADIIIQHWHYAKASKNFVSRPQKQTYFGTAVERRSKNAGKNKKKNKNSGGEVESLLGGLWMHSCRYIRKIHPKCAPAVACYGRCLRYSDTQIQQHQQPTKHVQNFFFDSSVGCCVLACAKRIMLGCANGIDINEEAALNGQLGVKQVMAVYFEFYIGKV